MTNQETAELALAVGRRVRPGMEFYRHVACKPGEVMCRWPGLGGEVWPYNPTVPGQASAEALAWLWVRCEEVMFQRADVTATGSGARVGAYTKTGMVIEAFGATPEEAVARIIADWPGEEG